MQQMVDGAAAAAEAPEPGFLDRIRRAVDVLRFQRAAIDEVATDRNAVLPAAAIVALAGVAAANGAGLFLPAYVGMAALYVVASVVLAGIIHLGATQVLGARADFLSFYAAFAQTYLLLWLVGIPLVERFMTWGLWAWQVAAAVYIAERVYRLARVRAAGVVLVPLAVLLLVVGLLSGFFALFALVTGWLF
jgi:hypothetical protein